MFRLTGGRWGKHLEKKHRHHHHDVPQRLFRSHSSSSLRRRCFALCEQPSAKNWQTAAVTIMWSLCVKRITLSPLFVQALRGQLHCPALNTRDVIHEEITSAILALSPFVSLTHKPTTTLHTCLWSGSWVCLSVFVSQFGCCSWMIAGCWLKY